MDPMTALSVASSLAGLFGKNKKPDPVQGPNLPGYDSRAMEPVLRNQMAIIDQQGAESWNEKFRMITEAAQARGITAGSPMLTQMLANAARQHEDDIRLRKQSMALELYNTWLTQRGQDLSAWQTTAGINAGQQQQTYQNQQAGQASVGQLFGNILNKDKPMYSPQTPPIMPNTVNTVGGSSYSNSGVNLAGNFGTASLPKYKRVGLGY